MRKIAVLTSGGDAPGMNAAIRAVVRKGIYEGLEVVGVRRGYAGLVEADFMSLTLNAVGDIIHRGGTILYTARSPRFMTPEGQEDALAALQGAGIEGLVVIGGDGSFRGAMALGRHGVPVIGIPATIDNDIFGTDLSIGFDTAVNTALEAINRIRDTATALDRTFVIEVMGRDAGFIAVAAGLAGGAESILIPEVPMSAQAVCDRISRGRSRGKRHSLIIVAEGAGSAIAIGEEIKRCTGLDTRVTVLGHIQRGGSPTAVDRILASRFGARAVEALRAGRYGVMIGCQGEHLVERPLLEVVDRRREMDPSLLELAEVLAI